MAARGKTERRFIATTGDAAGYLPPDGQARDELLNLVQLGLRFRAQHTGRRPGLLARTVRDCVARVGPRCTFAELLVELDLLAAERAEARGGRLPPVESVSRSWEVVRFHDPRRGEIEVSFSALRAHLTAAKKILKG